MGSPSAENGNRLNSDEKEEEISTNSIQHEKRKRIFFETKSLAEIYAKQGHVSMAVETYRRILKKNPSDVEAEERISELEAHLFTRRGLKPKEQTNEI